MQKSWIAGLGDRKRTVAGPLTRLPQTKRRRDGGSIVAIEGGILVTTILSKRCRTSRNCGPDDADETVTRVYDPPWSSIPSLELENGQPIIPQDYAANLRARADGHFGSTNARLRFIGYTKNERLDRRNRVRVWR